MLQVQKIEATKHYFRVPSEVLELLLLARA